MTALSPQIRRADGLRAHWAAAGLFAALIPAGANAQSGSEFSRPGVSEKIRTQVEVEQVAESDHGCATSCATGDTKLGLSLVTRHQSDNNDIQFRATFGRTNDTMFDLDRRQENRPQEVNGENLLATLSMETLMFDGLIKLSSEYGASSRSFVAAAPSLLARERIVESRGSAQNHALTINLVREQQATFALDARYASSRGSYQPFSVGRRFAAFAMPGESLRIGTRGRLGQFNLNASVWTQSSNLSSSESRELALGWSGVTLRARQSSRELYPLETVAASDIDSGRKHRSRRLGIDIAPLALFPKIAMNSSVAATLMPKTLSVDVEQRKHQTDRINGPANRDLTRFSLTGLWITPLGDTLVSFDDESGNGGQVGGGKIGNRNILIDHSTALGQWSLSGNLLLSTSADGVDDTTTIAYYGLSAQRAFRQGVKLKIEVGRDQFDVDTIGGAFTLRDRATSARLSADLTEIVRKRFRRDDLTLRLEGRLEFGQSGYELRFDDSVFDAVNQQRHGHGIMLTFGAKLP